MVGDTPTAVAGTGYPSGQRLALQLLTAQTSRKVARQPRKEEASMPAPESLPAQGSRWGRALSIGGGRERFASSGGDR
jgi:hypothetical protein